MPACVLIVDDMPDARNLLRLIVSKKRHYAVLEADCGEAAIRVANAHQPDLILLDYMMPDLDGITVLRRLRQTPELSRTPVIMLTALSDPATRKQALAAGAASFLTKPVKPLDLLAEIDRVLRMQQTEHHTTG